MKTAEIKYLTAGNRKKNIQLYHDVGTMTGPTTNQAGLFFDPWQWVSQGANYKQHIGDQSI